MGWIRFIISSIERTFTWNRTVRREQTKRHHFETFLELIHLRGIRTN